MTPKASLFIFYDGNCGFCNFWIQWILNKDQKNHFHYAPLQGDFGQKFLKERNLESSSFNTLYLWKPEEYYLQKSNAVLKIAEILGGSLRFLRVFYLIPKFLRDLLYDAISKNRQKLMNASCISPNEEQRKKFIY